LANEARKEEMWRCGSEEERMWLRRGEARANRASASSSEGMVGTNPLWQAKAQGSSNYFPTLVALMISTTRLISSLDRIAKSNLNDIGELFWAGEKVSLLGTNTLSLRMS
jgi:hypothetical protein